MAKTTFSGGGRILLIGTILGCGECTYVVHVRTVRYPNMELRNKKGPATQNMHRSDAPS